MIVGDHFIGCHPNVWAEYLNAFSDVVERVVYAYAFFPKFIGGLRGKRCGDDHVVLRVGPADDQLHGMQIWVVTMNALEKVSRKISTYPKDLIVVRVGIKCRLRLFV